MNSQDPCPFCGNCITDQRLVNSSDEEYVTIFMKVYRGATLGRKRKLGTSRDKFGNAYRSAYLQARARLKQLRMGWCS